MDNDKPYPSSNSTKKNPPSIARTTLKWVLWLCSAILFVVILLSAVLFTLPRVVSSEWVKKHIERHIIQTLHRGVRIDRLNWTWTGGILLEGLQIEEDPDFSVKPLISIDRVLLAIDLEQLIHRRLVIDLKLTGLDARLIRNRDGLTNIELLFSRIGLFQKRAIKPKPGDRHDVSFAIPIDIQTRLQFNRVSFQVEDRTLGRTISVRDASFLLDAPSLLHKPITLSLSMEPEMEGRALPPIHIEGRVENLIDSQASLNLHEAVVKIDGHFPGASIAIQGALFDTGLKGEVQLDLAPLTDIARPFLASLLPDLSGRIDLSINASGKQAESITFSTTLNGTDLNVSGGPLRKKRAGPLHFSAVHKGRINPGKGTLDIETGEIQIQENSHLSWQATVSNLTDPEPRAAVTLSPVLDLGEISDLAGPFIPADLSGRLELDIKASGGLGGAIAYAVKVKGRGLTVSGGLLKNRHAGPVSFNTSHKGKLNIQEGILDVEAGDIQIQNKSRFSWHGTMIHRNGSDPAVDLTVSSLLLNLKEFYALATEFMPAGMPLQLDEQSGGSPAELRLENLRFKGPLSSGPGHVKFNGFLLTFPRFRMATPAGLLSAETLDFQISEGEVGLESSFPSQGEISARLQAKNFYFKGAEEIKLKRLEVPLCHLVATNIAPSPKALFGVTGKIVLNESCILEGLVAQSRGQIPRLRQSMEAECMLGPASSAKMHLKRIEVSSPSVRVESIPPGPIETGVELKADVTDLELRGLSPLRIDVKKIRASLEAGKLFQVRVEALARDLGRGKLDTRGQITLNVGSLTPMLPPDLLPKADMNGMIEVDWEFLGRLPGEDETGRLIKKGLPLFERLRHIEFLEKFQILASLKDFEMSLPLFQGSRLKVSGIRSITPLKLSLKNGLKHAIIDGKIYIGRIEELPSIGKLDQPMQVTISMAGSQKDLKTVMFSGAIRVDPFNIEHSVELSLNKIDQLLMNGLKSPIPLLLKQIEGKAISKIRAEFDTDLSKQMEGLTLKGNLEADTEIDLTGGKEIKIRSLIKTSDLDIQLGEMFQVKNLQSHLNIEKMYRLMDRAENVSNTEPPLPPLSVEVLNPKVDARSNSEAQESIARRLMDDLQGRLTSRRSLSFESARIQLGPLPIKLSNHGLEFRLRRSLPSIDYFQLDLLGGTVIGSLSISAQGKAFALEADFSFSGLNANSLFTDGPPGLSDEEAELSGQIALWIPISTDSRLVLRDLRVSILLTHIGSKALERFLYAMDPYESNETLVRQRNLLRVGTPRSIELRVRHGNLSMSGEVEVKGVSVELPRIERLSIADLPVSQQLEAGLSALVPIVDILRTMSADSIQFGPEGAMRFVSSGP